jgi:hypothetical protein
MDGNQRDAGQFGLPCPLKVDERATRGGRLRIRRMRRQPVADLGSKRFLSR